MQIKTEYKKAFYNKTVMWNYVRIFISFLPLFQRFYKITFL
jgi:hypothetical protein